MKFKILAFILILMLNVSAQEVLDKIVAVVDDEIIMKSELDFQIQLLISQRKINPNTPNLPEKVLNTMVEEKLIYAQAKLDSISISEDEIDKRVDYQIELFKQQYGGTEKVEEIYGMSIEKIKRQIRDDIAKNAMVQRLQEKNFSSIEAGRHDVEEFFDKFKDSLGVIPEKVQISHIFRNPKASDKLKKQFYDFAASLLDSLKAGKDFAELARKYSEDPGSASHGGDLGWVKKGVFYPEFEAAAFALSEGEISPVVESPVGFHIIQLLEKRGEAIHTRHILIKVKSDEQADLNAIEFLSELRDSIIKGYGTFSDYAKKYSEDAQTKSFGGEIGTFYINQLDKNLLDIVSKLKEGEISFPKRLELGPGSYGYHIVYLEKRTFQHKADLEQDYDQLKNLATEFKRQKKYEEWMKTLRKNIYWEIRL